MAYRAVDRHNMIGGRGFRLEQLDFLTFVFQFLGLMTTVLTIRVIQIALITPHRTVSLSQNSDDILSY